MINISLHDLTIQKILYATLETLEKDMENEIIGNNPSIIPTIEQIPQTTLQTAKLDIVPKHNYSFYILIALLLVILVGVSIYWFTYNNQSAKKQIALPTNSPTTVSNPNTGDLYQDISVRMKELLP